MATTNPIGMQSLKLIKSILSSNQVNTKCNESKIMIFAIKIFLLKILGKMNIKFSAA